LKSIHYRSVSSWLAIIGAIFIRDLDRRVRNTPVAGLMIIFEPLLLIAALGALHYFIREGVPIYGDSMALFLATGFLPFYLFVHSSRGLSKDLTYEREYPVVNDADIQIARLLIEVVRNAIISIGLYSAIYFYGIDEAAPTSYLPIIQSSLVLIALSLGIGLMNSALISVFQPWALIYGPLSRGLFFGSGIYSVVDFYPARIRDIIEWNPLAHCIMWFRTGFYPDYPTFTLNQSYATMCAGVILTLGFVAFYSRAR